MQKLCLGREWANEQMAIPTQVSGTSLSCSADLSYVAYTNDLLLISRAKIGLSLMVSTVAPAV